MITDIRKDYKLCLHAFQDLHSSSFLRERRIPGAASKLWDGDRIV